MTKVSTLRNVRAISLDVTGTLIRHLDPIADTYSNAMYWSGFPKPLTPTELKPAFKTAYRKTLEEFPYFGAESGLSSRQWWEVCVKKCLTEAGIALNDNYSNKDFNRWFRKVYQHYGCSSGYVPMHDAFPFVKWATTQGYLLGVTTNTPRRTMDSVLPFMGLHQYFRTFTCSQDAGSEKPEAKIFDHSFEELKYSADLIISNSTHSDEISGNDISFVNKYQQLRKYRGGSDDLQPHEILHIGDSLPADLCGAKAAGWQAFYLNRSNDPNVRVYQDWLEAPNYEGKSETDIKENTVFSLDDVSKKLEEANITG